MKYIAAYALMILSPQPQEANNLTHRHLRYCRAGLHHLSSITQHVRTLHGGLWSLNQWQNWKLHSWNSTVLCLSE